MSIEAQFKERIKNFYNETGKTFSEGKHLRCTHCGESRNLSQDDAIHYTKFGWPKCCGYTMRLKSDD